MVPLRDVVRGLGYLFRGDPEPVFRYLSDSIRPYPYLVAADCSGHTGVFEVTTDVEEYRTKQFGGEKEYLRRALRVVESGDVVWDVGANVGLWSVFFARTGASVHAFEPEPDFAARLRRNIYLNGQTNQVEVDERALGQESGEFDLYTEGIGGASPRLTGRNGLSQTVTVSVSRGSEVDATDPDVLKIDVEGAEMDVLDGLGDRLDEVRVLCVEVHPRMAAEDDLVEAVKRRLRDAGLETEWERTRNEQRQLILRRQ